jgi:DNA-binding MarR family transcriptional regulator
MYIILPVMKFSLTRRFGFLVNEIARTYSQQFDRRAREELGLSQAQVRLLAVLSAHDSGEPISQAELAQRMGLTPMAVTSLCDRMAAAGWIERRPSPSDRRANELYVRPKARDALTQALAIGDELSSRTLASLTAAERTQLLALLAKARDGLLSLSQPPEAVS